MQKKNNRNSVNLNYKSLLIMVCVLIVGIYGWLADEKKQDRQDTYATEQSESQSAQQDTKEQDAGSYVFTNKERMMEHFEKHGEEFPYATVEEYVAGANRVINDPQTLHKFEKEDGDDVYYLEESNEIVFVSSLGYIRSYFKPDKGITYYNEQ